jgi:hypothetical protein
LAGMYPATGCPLEFYEEIVLPFDERIKSALESQKKVALQPTFATGVQRQQFKSGCKIMGPSRTPKEPFPCCLRHKW